MCTVSIKVNDNLLHRAWANMDKDVDMAEWMQQQIEAILLRMTLVSEKNEAMQRIKTIAEAKGEAVSLLDFEGILPASKLSFEELRDEYISEKYGV